MNKKIFYSAKENTFFFESMKADYEKKGYWPADLREVSQDEYQVYAGEKPPEGKKRGGDSSGNPVWVDIPAPTVEQLMEQAEQTKRSLVDDAGAEISWLQDAVDENIATEKEISLLSEWKKYRVLLMRIDISQAPDIQWPEVPGYVA